MPCREFDDWVYGGGVEVVAGVKKAEGGDEVGAAYIRAMGRGTENYGGTAEFGKFIVESAEFLDGLGWGW